MSHIRVLQVLYSPKGETLKLVPGEFGNHREATEALTEEGDYLFLEVHHITPAAAGKKKKANGNKGSDKEEE